MKVVNAVKFIFPGISENERTARAVVSAFLVQLDPTVEELADIRTAVSEAVTNAIVHGYRKSRGDVELHMKLLEDREVYLRIKDHGCGIADITQAMQPLFTTAPKKNVPDWALRSWKASWTSCKSRVHRKRERL